MPYTLKTAPAPVKKLPLNKQKMWIAIFNNAQRACLDKGGSTKTCESSSFAKAWGVLNKRESRTSKGLSEDKDMAAGKTKPKDRNWLTNLVDWLRGDSQQRALSMDNLMQKVYKRLYEMEDENKTYYSIARFMFDEKGPWLVINDHGALYRTDLTISADGEVTLGDMIEVKEEYVPVPKSRVFVKRQADGQARFFAIVATTILNRDNEIDSSKLFDNMIQHAQEENYYPAIDIHHLGSKNPDVFEIGYADFLMRAGVCYVASGILDESKLLGRKMVEKLETMRDSPDERPWGCSIEYFPIEHETIELNMGENGTLPVDVYVDGVNTRISFLPEQRAASWFTQVTLKE